MIKLPGAMKKLLVFALGIVLSAAFLQAQEHTTVIEPLPGECWWGAVVNKGYMQPYTNFSARDNYYLDDPVPAPKPTSSLKTGYCTLSPSMR